MMFIFYTIAIIITSAYFLLLIGFIIGWNSIKVFEKGSSGPFPFFISVVIAARNEERNIADTLISLSDQNISPSLFEVIIVDDFSSDDTQKIATAFCKTHKNFNFFKLEKHEGKKQALDFGIKQARGKLIVTTDADCSHHTKWLETISNYYVNNKAKMIIAPVLIRSDNWFGHMQSLDFLALMASGAAATGINRPIMNNGANLAFSKKAYLSINDPTNKTVSSGDDVFLLLSFKKAFPKSIHFLKSKKAVVYTKPKESFTEYINQRKRWASKSKHYRDFDIIYTAINVLLINSFLLFSILAIFVSTNSLLVFLSVFVIKSILDYVFLYKTSSFFGQRKLLVHFFTVQFANLLLIPFLAVSGLFTKTKWKGTTVNK